MQIARLPDIDEGTWGDVKKYVEGATHADAGQGRRCRMLQVPGIIILNGIDMHFCDGILKCSTKKLIFEVFKLEYVIG